MVLESEKMKCPVCGSPVNCGSVRPAEVYPNVPEPSYTEYFYLSIFYCTKSDAHMFAVMKRRPQEAEE